MQRALLLLGFLFGLASCDSGHDFVYKKDNMFVMSNPSVSNQEHFLVKGGKAVVEITETSSASSAKVSGLSYSQVVWDQTNWLNKTQLDEVSKSIAGTSGAPILIHSSDINKASAWLALHMVKVQGQSIEAALAAARESGLTKEWEAQLLVKLKAK